MTISLAIDTATSRTIVGVVDNGVVVFEEFHEGLYTGQRKIRADYCFAPSQAERPKRGYGADVV